jgi:endonuclease/exonuclease/phosphatase family metal-dependent hydrolase
LKFYRFFFLTRRVQKRVLENLKEIIKKEKPDLICLIEIKKGKQIAELINEKYSFYDIKTKYGRKSFLRKLPFFHNRSNAFISKNKLSYKERFLVHGTKKLMYEITLPNNTKLILAHFSLKKKMRRKQFKEIYKKYADEGSKIICGDFNVAGGFSELDYLVDKLDLEVTNKEPTFPAFAPKRSFDLFLCSKTLKTDAKVLKTQLSDHLPVMLEMYL